MKPIAVSLDKLQGDKNVSVGSVLPCLHYIKNALGGCELKTKMSTNHKVQAIGNDMIRSLKTAFQKRFDPLLIIDDTNRELVLAAVSHPVYKLKWIIDERDLANAKRLFEGEVKNMESIPKENVIEELDIEDDEFISTHVHSSTRRASSDSRWANEAFNFVEDRKKNLEMLDQYPLVSAVFRKYNTTLSSSGPIERLFSQALIIYTPRRNRISHINFERTLLLRKNQNLLN